MNSLVLVFRDIRSPGWKIFVFILYLRDGCIKGFWGDCQELV